MEYPRPFLRCKVDIPDLLGRGAKHYTQYLKIRKKLKNKRNRRALK